MPYSAGPDIITNSLVLNLDAADINSYPGPTLVDVMVVGGGGGGGMDMGGGGGGGGVVYQKNVSVTPGTPISVTVGAGGWGAPAGSGGYRGDGVGPQPGGHQFTIGATAGGNSVFGSITALGGGFGASSYFGYTPNYGYGGSGGSGGGASGYSDGNTGRAGAGTAGQGYNGGGSGGQYYAGGGGGAGGPGIGGTSRPDGGPGILIPEMSPFYFGGGGGGGSYSLSTGGYGGIGGGGGGALGTTFGGAGLNNGSPGGGGSPGMWAQTPGGNAGANTGGGGGGGSHYNATNQGGNGGSGIVIVRYQGPQGATGGNISYRDGYTYHTFLSSGTFTPGGIGNWYDTSGNGYVATGGNFQPSAGGGSYALFSGTAATVASSAILNNDFHSIFMIIRFKEVGGNSGVNGSWSKFFTYAPAGTDRSPGVWRWPSERIIHWRYDPGNSGCDFLDYYGTGGQFALNQDYFIGVTKNGSSGIPYVNGIQVPIYSGGAVSSPKTAGDAPIIFFEGYQAGMMEIKNCLIYNKALSSTEVLQNYNEFKTRLR